MKMVIVMLIAAFLGTGCAQVEVKAPKDPIKLDVSMRVDVYQHIENDIDSIESKVSGSRTMVKRGGAFDIAGLFIPSAEAEEGLSAEIDRIALSRQDRLPQIRTLQADGVFGENSDGFLVIRKAQAADASVKALMAQENADRQNIYELLARKNGSTVTTVKVLYAIRLQKDAPSGTPIEVLDDGQRTYVWKTK